MKLYKDPVLFTNVQNHTTFSSMCTAYTGFRPKVYIIPGCYLQRHTFLSYVRYVASNGDNSVNYDLVKVKVKLSPA
jgi:hypothetical protein